MNVPPSLDRVAGQIFETAQGAPVLALPPIAEALGGSYSLLFRADRQRGMVEEASCCGVDTAYVDRLKHAARERLLPAWLDGLVAGSVRDRAAFGTDQEFARTPFYDHVIRPEGRFHCLIATPLVSDRGRFHLIVGRPRSHEAFNGCDQGLLQALLPHLGEILRLQARLVETQAFVQDAFDHLGSGNSPVMIVSAAGGLLFANQAARRWLSVVEGLRIDQGSRSLVCGHAADTKRLRHALSAAAMRAGVQSVTLPGSGGPTLHLTIRRCAASADPGRDSGGRDVRLMLHVEGPAWLDGQERAETVARDYGLTHRERELLARIIAGETLQRAASQLGMTYNTGRTHLRQVFGKTDLHRQSDLLRFCATGRRPGQ